ncbi:TrbI/VirB10 family protein [Stakelama marina]|uniref:TrbI/VirB10 family protein n=1 Tax=Stakelama marina TaxID=2826939 RepID=A0A8T4IMZ6_9SPHN|nr:TrbI/VirB10 family protein [Stakelama marina]MBR0553536.1 TrbI/VirB10 family protein [Stakelama marina]
MNEESKTEPPPDAESIVQLRGEAPRVVRLSRKAIGIASAAGLTVLGGILLYALQPASQDVGEELVNTDGIAVADGLATAPTDYSQVPRLGPPLPGDLGQPILEAQDRGAVAALPPVGGPPPTPSQRASPSPEDMARERLEQEREAARGSRLFFGSGTPAANSSPAASGAGPQPPAPVQPSVSTARPSFLERPADMQTASVQRLEAVPSGWLLRAGSIIPAALITGIRSDQPGLVTAQVTENVYDSLTGRHLLIPQGARLIGEYESDVGFGQRRLLLAWTRLILPDGRSIVLDRQPAADPSGYAGLEDGVDYHWGGVVKAALVSTLLGIGGELGAGGDDDLLRAVRRGTQDSINRAGEQVVARELDIRPTLTIRPGFPVRVLVTRDIVLEGGA